MQVSDKTSSILEKNIIIVFYVAFLMKFVSGQCKAVNYYL